MVRRKRVQRGICTRGVVVTRERIEMCTDVQVCLCDDMIGGRRLLV